MASLGLLGALGGFGEGLTKMGEDIIKRREQALEWARQEAIEQRRLAARAAEKSDDRQFETSKTIYQANRQAGIKKMEIEARAAEAAEERKWKETDREDEQSHDTEQERFKQGEQNRRTAMTEGGTQARTARKGYETQASKRYTELRKALLASGSETGKRLAARLAARDDIVGVAYGPANEDGTVKLMVVPRGGGDAKYSGYDLNPSLLAGATEDEDDDF